MRIHRLTLDAFGPYAHEQSVDFDRLNEAGLFLLTGPTGAGKTSVLDAICFALYGAVPGERNNAKSLKSHHADPLAVPLVELDVSVRGRRFRLRRSPAWSRPSKRARSGRVDEQARATMSELVDGEWVARSNRLDEVGHLVTRVLGMNRDQFCQVVMLPQGRFQTFLTAGAKERHDVLEALFETSRFQRIEKWLGEHRRAAERAHTEQEARLRELAARIEEANDAPLHEPGGSLDELQPETLAALTAAAIDTVALGLDDARERERAAASAAKQARHAVDEARMLADRQQRIREARRTIEELDATADEHAARQRLVASARAAEQVWPLVDVFDQAEQAHEAALGDLAAAHSEAERRGVGVPVADLASAEAAEERLQARLAVVSELGMVESLATRLRDEVTGLDAQLTAVDDSAHERRVRAAAIPGELADTEAALAALAPIADGLTGARERLRAVEQQAAAALSAAEAAEAVAVLRTRVEVRRAASLDAREAWLTVRQAYLDGWAAVLAGGLRDGEGCPVCGGLDHPSPATPLPGHVNADDEAAALAVAEQAEQQLAAAVDELAAADRRLATLQAVSAGLSAADADARLAEAAAALSQCDAAVADTAQQATLLRELHDEQLAIAAADGQAATVAAGLAARREAAHDRLVEAVERLRSVIPEGQSVAAELRLVDGQVEACRRLTASLRRLEHTGSTLAARLEAVGREVASAGFGDVGAVRAARMTAADLANAEALNRAAVEARAAAVAVLADPALVEAAAAPEVDLGALEAASADADSLHGREAQASQRLGERLQRLEVLAATFADELAALEPLRRRRDLAVQVAAMCAGTSADNVTHTRLSHYVLSQRLRQVVDAANGRLAGISGGRYELEHQMQRGVGDTRGGLGLRVHDTHTGRSRDPATLSGGETFYVSLALALGLADLVRDEIGGVELSTLFVDEGFGGLDADTLDEVMDELDSLRSGGRVVGIVSHVQDLRLRVPAQLRVEAPPGGSRLVLAD